VPLIHESKFPNSPQALTTHMKRPLQAAKPEARAIDRLIYSN
jgi:hypothetical protein